MRTYSPFCGRIYDRWAYYFSCCIQKKTCLTDSPSERKAHIGEVALVGGLAIGMDLTVSLTMLPTPEKNIWVVIFMAVLVITGAIDDRITIKPKYRLLV